MAITPEHLPERLRAFADAVEVAVVRSPGFYVNRVMTGIALRLDCGAAVLPEPLRERLVRSFGATLELVENAPRGQRQNLEAAVARLAGVIDSHTRAEEAQMSLVVEAQAVLEAIARGEYVAPSGQTVSIRDATDAAVRGTELIEPERFAALEAALPAAASARTAIEVTTETTSAAARRLVVDEREANVVALNFASAVSVCGGFLRGAKAQEEDLARQSALYPCLEPQRAYYDANRALRSDLYTDAMIYSPEVPFFRDDGLRWLETPFAVSILTVPAPACRNGLDPADPRVHETIRARVRKLLVLAAARGHRTLVLGAWGCGAFRNDPDIVSSAFATALRDDDGLRGRFARVVFAVWDPGGRNLAAFERRFGRATLR